MPLVTVTMREGRNVEQVRQLVAGITEAVVDAVEVSPDRVRVLVYELPPERIGQGGALATDATSAVER